MRRLLIFAGLALATQALPLEPGSTTEYSSLPQPSPGPGPAHEGPANTPEATTAHPSLSADLISQHMLMGWSLPQPGPGREAPIVTLEPTTSTKPDLIEKIPLEGSPGTEAISASSKPTAAPIRSLYSPEWIQNHMLMGWSLPEPGVDSRLTSEPLQQWEPLLSPVHIRPIRSAPRALPAHKAHGPRAVLPYGLYPRKNARG